MLGLRRLCAAVAAVFALHPLQEHAVRAHRSEQLALDAAADADHETAVSGGSLATVPHQSAALVETTFIDPISMTVISGIGALGSLYSVGKQIADGRARRKQRKKIANAIQHYEEQSVAGCNMLDTAAWFLVQKMEDLDILYKGMSKLSQACSNRDGGLMKSYLAFLKTRLEDTCERSPGAIQRECRDLFINSFPTNVDEACGKATSWSTQEELNRGKMGLRKYVWQMDGLKRGACGKGLAGVGASALFQRSQARVRSGAGLVDEFGLAFTLCGLGDMLVTVGDDTMRHIWGSGVQGLLSFSDSLAEEAHKAVCRTATAIWLKSFVPGHAVKLASLGLRMVEVSVDDETVQRHLDRLARLPHDGPQGWDLAQQSVYLCDHRRACMTPMPKIWSQGQDGVQNPDLGGTQHAHTSCLKDSLEFVRVCDEQGALINAVPRACFRTYAVQASSQLKSSKIGSNNNHEILGSGQAHEFCPSGKLSFGASVTVHDEKFDLEACLEPLRALWNMQVNVMVEHFRDTCPEG